MALNVHILPQNPTSDLSHYLLSFIFNHSLVCVCMCGGRPKKKKKAKVTRKSVSKCVQGNKTLLFFLFANGMLRVPGVCMCRGRGVAVAREAGLLHPRKMTHFYF